MGKGFQVSQRLETGVGLRVDPRVVTTSRLLQLGRHELDQAIEAELNENPALDRLVEEPEPLDEQTILRTVAPNELRPGSEDFEFRRSLPQDDGHHDWIELAADTPTLRDHLRAQLIGTVAPQLVKVCQYLVEGVDERGYLTLSVEEAALACGCTLEDAESALTRLQACEPAGVGAASLQQCLLLQLRNADTIERKLARAIIRSHLDDFVARRTLRLARRFRVLPDVIEAASTEIMALNPYPGEGFGLNAANRSSRASGITPDLVLSRTELGWEIDVPGPDASSLCVNRFYRRRLSEMHQTHKAAPDERRHVVTYVRRATDFIASIQQRKRTLRRIGEYLSEHQGGFVSTGSYRFLQPLTRAQMAADLGLHESTVSRATMDKFVQIANGETIQFEVFFRPALRVQKMIEEILATENPGNPLSDERIAELLAEQGVVVARRTVNKYRDRTKLLSSRKRRSA
ncbi:MAG: RNA polymerase factor sigma-54 [Fimbriimonas ginsengisoli]|uniref:RNA polymerase factor sigma-54 n=1 Tax=Fimbriimonas ginsengisoli TaxID=1005039 RepID=A0A931PUG3_FIMGI|nr:RNA polymerase factor sigma-54 [Fimbriimonas ginsengisoli]